MVAFIRATKAVLCGLSSPSPPFPPSHRMADFTTTPLRNVWRFPDAWELELAARCCRAWVPYEDALLVPEAVALAESIIKVG